MILNRIKKGKLTRVAKYRLFLMQVLNLLLQDHRRYTCENRQTLDKRQYICLSHQFMVDVLLVHTTEVKVLTVVPLFSLNN